VILFVEDAILTTETAEIIPVVFVAALQCVTSSSDGLLPALAHFSIQGLLPDIVSLKDDRFARVQLSR